MITTRCVRGEVVGRINASAEKKNEY